MGLHIQFNDKDNNFVGFYISDSSVKYKIVKEDGKSTLHLLHSSNNVIQVCEYVEFIKISNDQGTVLHEEKSSYQETNPSLPVGTYAASTILEAWLEKTGNKYLITNLKLAVGYGEGLTEGKQRVFITNPEESPKFIAAGFKDPSHGPVGIVPLWVIDRDGLLLEFNEVWDGLKKELGFTHYKDDLFNIDTGSVGLHSYKTHTSPVIHFSDKEII